MATVHAEVDGAAPSVETGDLADERAVVHDLETLLDEITPDNLHAEIETGSPVGAEIW